MEGNTVSLEHTMFQTSQPPHTWFTQAEAQFHLRKIAIDETKYFYVISSLDEENATGLLISQTVDDDTVLIRCKV